MPGLQGFPICLQGFQQVEEAFLRRQGVGASVRTQEFELVLQLGDIISYGHHFVFALWKSGNMPPPLAEGCGLRSFFFAAVRPIGLGSSFIFLRCPEEKRTKKKGTQSGKRTRPMASNSFSRGGRHRKQHLPNPQGTMDTCTQNWEKNPGYDRKTASPEAEDIENGIYESPNTKTILLARQGKGSGLRLLTAFPGAGNAGCIFYPLYKGAQASLPDVVNLSVSPALFCLTGGKECSTREKLSERSEFFSRSEAPFFW